jgi:pimeloyl-ACP methyl ester carboxylesterase
MMTKAPGEYVAVDGINTYVIHKGNGRPLLIIHGGAPGASARVNWGANIDFLADNGFAVYAYDQPGYGHTDVPEDLSMEFRVTHANALIKTLGLDRFNILGNSQGSYIAARLALEHPGVQKMVLVSSGTLAPRGGGESEALSREHAERLAAYEPSLENMRALSMQTLYDSSRLTDEFVRERYEMSTGRNFEANKMRRGTPAPRPIYGELKNLKVPTLLLWGAHDSGVALERSLLLLQSMPGAELHIFDHAAHWVQWDQAERFNTIVRDFLLAGS